MKRTKNMIYKPCHNSENLYLYIVNTSELYHKITIPVIENLRKKAAKNNYDKEKAIDLFYRVACTGKEFYNKEFSYEKIDFSVSERFTVAIDLESRYNEDIFYDL